MSENHGHAMKMFSYRIPGGLCTKTYITPEGNLKFDPPVYEQRYTSAVRIIEDPCWKQQLKKIVDFGCAEIRLLRLMRRIPFVEHILEVDIDRVLLEIYQQRAAPLISDHLRKREKPLRVEVLEGSITDAAEQLYNVDAVIALEVIEHLHADVLEKVPENVFGFIQPKLAIFSTPNREFNVLFDSLLQNGFRHLDHKFEWTRKEFKKWALNICERYPNYSVSIMGVGKAPSGKRKLGHATQIAIFARNDMIGKPLNEDIKRPPINQGAQYRTVYAVDYPYIKDDRTKEQQILDEARYYIGECRYEPCFFNKERLIYQLPWKPIMQSIVSIGGTEKELLEILNLNDIKVEGKYIILPEYDEIEDNEDNFDDDSDGKPYKNDDEFFSGCINTKSSNTSNDSEEDWD